jgi:polysaccharide pyruvyl transferase WcaK-like protein
LAKNILSKVGYSAEVLPCTSIFANDYYSVPTGKSDFIAMNYMKLGGHYDFSKNVNTNNWEQTFIKLYNELVKYHKIKIICHDKVELAEINRFLPNSDIFYSENFVDYIKIYSHAKCTIVNRIHGLFAAASFGIPGIAIGNDSRALMTNEIGLESVYVNDAEFEILMNKIKLLLDSKDEYKKKMENIKNDAFGRYMDLFNKLSI